MFLYIFLTVPDNSIRFSIHTGFTVVTILANSKKSWIINLCLPFNRRWMWILNYRTVRINFKFFTSVYGPFPIFNIHAGGTVLTCYAEVIEVFHLVQIFYYLFFLMNVVDSTVIIMTTLMPIRVFLGLFWCSQGMLTIRQST